MILMILESERFPWNCPHVPITVWLRLRGATFHEHDRGKLLFQKYAQDALVRRKQHPPQSEIELP